MLLDQDISGGVVAPGKRPGVYGDEEMNPKEIKELIEFLVEKDIAEFELERGDLKMRLKRGREPQFVAPQPVAYAPVPAQQAASAMAAAAAPQPAAPVSVPAPARVEAAPEEDLHIVRSPTTTLDPLCEISSVSTRISALSGEIARPETKFFMVDILRGSEPSAFAMKTSVPFA